MPPTSLESIKKQYDPVWKALKPDSIQAYEDVKDEFSQRLNYFRDLLELTPPPKNILELACGSGIAAVELARQGYSVTAMDCSAEAIEVAKSLQQHVNVKVHWIQGDMRSFQLYDPMDYILLWDVAFGIFASAREDSRVLEQISRALNVGGRCLFQFYHKTFAIQHGIENRYFYKQADDLFELDDVNHDLPIKRVKLYSQNEWQQMLHQVNMKIIRVESSGFPDDPSDGPARLCHLVAEKWQ